MRFKSLIFLLCLKSSASCFISDTAIVSNDFLPSPVKVQTVQDCQVACKNLSPCRYFSFKPALAECNLFFTKVSTKSENGTIWGPKFCDKDQDCFELQRDYYKGDISYLMPISSLYQCQLECLKLTNCLSISWKESINRCHLKNGSNTYPRFDPAYSAGKRVCEESYCLDYEVNYGGPNVGYVQWAPSATHCQFECQKNDQCLYFGYRTTTGQCYFKSAKGTTRDITAVSGPKFCPSKEGCHKYTQVKPSANITKGQVQQIGLPTVTSCASHCNALYMKYLKCSGFQYDEDKKVCQTFVFGPGSYNFFYSDEKHINAIHIRDDVYG